MSGKLSDVGFGKASCKWYASAQVDHVVRLDSWFSQAKVGPYDQLGSLIDRGRVNLIQGPFQGKPDTELYVKCDGQLDQTLRKVFEEVAAALLAGTDQGRSRYALAQSDLENLEFLKIEARN